MVAQAGVLVVSLITGLEEVGEQEQRGSMLLATALVVLVETDWQALLAVHLLLALVVVVVLVIQIPLPGPRVAQELALILVVVDQALLEAQEL
jgi:hypothetical protein